jgi:hypothetical protein
MHKNTTKCKKTLSKWCKNKHGASKIIDTFETYQTVRSRMNWFIRIWLDEIDGDVDEQAEDDEVSLYGFFSLVFESHTGCFDAWGKSIW